MRKYVLSTGQVTDRIEYYILDLFKLYLKVYPGDIPGASSLGFNFNLLDTRKADIPSVVSSKVNELVSNISSRFTGGLSISLDSVEIISETRAKVVVTVNNVVTDDIYINLYDEK